ncbi:MAG: amino acid adenylation domain-containing protein, partial [Bacteroidota bacterium]
MKNIYQIKPLSTAQKSIWIDQQLHPDVPLYNIGGYYDIFGEVDVETFRKALQQMVRDVETLRIKMTETDGTPGQIILDDLHAEIPFHDLSHHENPQQASLDWLQVAFEKPFDLVEGPLFRYALLKIGDQHFRWLLCYHHLIVDGWGISLLVKRAGEHYAAQLDAEAPFTPIFPYTAFLKADSEYLSSSSMEKDRAFWADFFQPLPEDLNLLSHLKPQGPMSKSLKKSLVIPRADYDKLIAIGKERRVSTFHLILAALQIYFGRTYQNQDIVYGTPILNRSGAKFKKTPGLFTGMIPLRLQSKMDMAFMELAEDIRNRLRSCLKHQKFPIDELYRSLNLNLGEGDYLYQITLSYEKHSYAETFAHWKGKITGMTNNHERTPLAIFVREYSDLHDIDLDFDGNAAFWTEEQLQDIAQNFHLLLQQIISDPNRLLSDYAILAPPIKALLQDQFNHNNAAYPQTSSLPQRLRKAATQYSDKVAAVHASDQWTYAELEAKSNRLAHQLQSVGVQKGQPVPVILSRGLDYLCSFLAILKCGATIVPISQNWPTARRQAVLRNIQAPLVLLHGQTTALEKEMEQSVLYVDAIPEALSSTFNLVPTGPEDIVYIIHTSGTTGIPKGVEVPYRGLVNRLDWMTDHFKTEAAQSVLRTTPQIYDSSVWQLLWPLLHGGRTIIPEEARSLDLEYVAELCDQHALSLTDFVPSIFTEALRADVEASQLASLQHIILGGEAIVASDVREFQNRFPSIRLTNLYGPTEASIGCVFHEVKKGFTGPIPIGQPIANTRIYILDEQQQLLPPTVPGELYIAGDCLAKGYLNDVERTKKAFVQDPFREEGVKMYRTGDRAAWSHDGALHFMGRIDAQVKIHGHRIELEGIAAQLRALDAVLDARVCLLKSPDNRPFLCGF